MIKLYNEQEFKNAPSIQKFPIECTLCHNVFFRTKHQIHNIESRRKNAWIFCGSNCRVAATKSGIYTKCANCDTPIYVRKSIYLKSKSKNFFCNQSCGATYNNTHKKHGCRRSKLEIYLEKEIKNNYPNLLMECNNKSIINSELDFYFPDLKFAIELNGIFHYEPIYGQDKFDKIINNDKQKFKLCLEYGIELCIIDTSKVSYLNQKIKEQYSKIIFEILNSIIGRIPLE